MSDSRPLAAVRRAMARGAYESAGELLERMARPIIPVALLRARIAHRLEGPARAFEILHDVQNTRAGTPEERTLLRAAYAAAAASAGRDEVADRELDASL